MLNTVDLYYFSPTGGTKKAADIFCTEIGQNVVYNDLGNKRAKVPQAQGELVVVAAPVFAGRIPCVMTEKIMQLHGEGKPAVAVVVYGNRAYDDALLELKNVLTERGFHVIGAAAFVAQHSLAPAVAKGRPDADDKKQIQAFADQVWEKVSKGIRHEPQVPGNVPYKAPMRSGVSPVCMETCSKCGKCVTVCPTDAIRMDDGVIVTNGEKCMLCMACAAACPEKARALPPPLALQFENKLGALQAVRGKNDWFI